MTPSLVEDCRARLREAETAGLLRALRDWESVDARAARIGGKELRNFASNDYLGLSTHQRVRAALARATNEVAGAGASRLITGNHPGYAELESELARFKRAEAALVFSSGYAAALGTIPALVGDGDFVVMDKLCHACLVDGAHLSGATLRVFPHNNLKRCGELLASCRKSAGAKGRVLLVTESLFSMDGDLAPLADLVELKRRHGAWLMVDEAHATGVLGKNGRGGAEHFGVEGEVEISMGTLSKALGCAGGFIGGAKELREWLVNRARSLIFSTALPRGVCAAGAEAVRVVREEPTSRAKLWENIRFLRDRLGRETVSPIIPIEIGDERRCVEAAEKLREAGFVVPAIRYPTVGRGKARLRVSVSAAHQREDLEGLVGALKSHAA